MIQAGPNSEFASQSLHRGRVNQQVRAMKELARTATHNRGPGPFVPFAHRPELLDSHPFEIVRREPDFAKTSGDRVRVLITRKSSDVYPEVIKSTEYAVLHEPRTSAIRSNNPARQNIYQLSQSEVATIHQTKYRVIG